MSLLRNKIFLAALALFVIGFVLYAPNLHNRLFWDDDDWIVNNASVHQLSFENIKFIFSHDTLAGIGLRSNYYRPVLFLTFMANYIVGGTNPLGYHIVSNLIHIANAFLIFFLLSYFTRRRPLAFVAALLFLVHPLQTEAVTYISGRGDPLSVLFMLTALVAFFRYRGEDIMGDSVSVKTVVQHRRWWLVVALVLQVAAMLSRETAFLFPIYLIIFLIAFYYRESFLKSLKKGIFQSLPFLGVSLVYGILRLTVLNFQNTLNFFKQANVYTEHLSYRIYTFFHVVSVYFGIIFYPRHLHMERDVLINYSLFQWPSWFGLLLILAFIGVLIVLYKKEKSQFRTHTSGQPITSFRIWLFGLGFFFLNLMPTSGIFPINALIYEHWLYFSLFGLFTILAFYVDNLWGFIRGSKYRLAYTFLCSIVGLVILVGLSVQTIRRNMIWGDTEAFYKNILSYEPKNARVLNNLANYYTDHSQPEKAEDLLRQAIAGGDFQAAPYYNLANILRDRGDLVGALALYDKSVQIDPNFLYGYLNAASLTAKMGNLGATLDYLQRALNVSPGNARLYFNIGQVHFALRNYHQSLLDMQNSLAYSAGDPEVEAAVKAFLSKNAALLK